MTITDLHSKLRAIHYEIELAEEMRDSLPDLYELKKAYMEAIADAESTPLRQVPIPA